MKEINKILKKYGLHPYRYEKNGNVIIIYTNEGKYIIKEKIKNSNIYKYLESRSFNYYPKIINNLDDQYEISIFLDQIEMPNEQKILDLIDLVSLLHNKTTHYKEVDISDYKKIYEDINNNINYLYSYYNDMVTVIETNIFMSPSNYLIARNISKIYASLNFCKGELNKWYDQVKNETKQRVVIVHNNLEIDHFIRNKNSYLISWNKAKIDSPIFDLYKLYKKHSLDYDFNSILNRYEHNYKLKSSERLLLFILISLPDKIELNSSEFKMCKDISNLIDNIYKTEKFLSPYYSKDAK